MPDPEKEDIPSERPSISIRTRLIIAFSVIFALCAIITIWSIITIDQVMDKIQFLETSDNYKAEIQEARRFEKNYLLYGTNLNDAEIHLQNAEKILIENEATIEKIIGKSDFNTMNKHLSDYHNLLTKIGSTQNEDEKKVIESALRDHGSQMIETALNFEKKERESVNQMLALTRRIPFIFLFLLLLSIIFVVSFLARQLLGTLARFMHYTERIGEGDFSPIPPHRKYRDEFSQLRMAFNKMIKEIDERERIMVESHKLRAVGTLVAGVAHELNNPLNNTMLTAAMLQEDFSNMKDDEKLEMVKDIINETERSQKIVRNLLDFAREGEAKLITLDLNDIVEGSVKLVANQIKLSQITLIKNFATNLAPIYGSVQMLQQVFINLILNSVEILPKKGTITISTYKSKEEDYEVVEISDNGPGIPEHILPRIFDPFFTTKSKRKGTGLGLSVSKGIINKLGGYIKAEGKQGSGASFKVFLPTTNIPSNISSH
ncbi:MAG: ATP-binding protein [Ignavibacteriaceae bacterium]